jgi:chromosome segregation ATPase
MSEVKNFKVGPELVSRMEEVISKSGKNNKEYFIDWVQQEEKRLVEEETMGFSPDLSRSFSEDVRKLEDALSVINNVYVSQMKSLNTKLESERNRLEIRHSKQMFSMDDELKKVQVENGNLQKEIEEIKKQNETLLHDNEKLAPANQKLEETVVDKEKIIEGQTVNILRLNTEVTELQEHKEENKKLANEKNELEKQLDANNLLVEKLTHFIEELKVKHVEQISELKVKHAETLETIKEKHVETLETIKERAELEKERAAVEREKEVRAELNESIERYREENKNLYLTVDKLRSDKDVLRQEYEQQIVQLKAVYENKIKAMGNQNKKGTE